MNNTTDLLETPEVEDDEFYCRRESNVELLERLLNYSKYGGLMQMFVLDALLTSLDNILKDEQAFRDAQPERPIVSTDGWVGCAKEMRDALDNRKMIKERY